MQSDEESIYRERFLDFGDFPDRVDDPWEKNIPDIQEFNQKAYKFIRRQVMSIHNDKLKLSLV